MKTFLHYLSMALALIAWILVTSFLQTKIMHTWSNTLSSHLYSVLFGGVTGFGAVLIFAFSPHGNSVQFVM